ncbi:pyridoxamine 5'-phosphate oxidase family protein [Deinococcus hopiensis]|uniref:pyridoxamine 5'-phosphate oxidase family protein n=1 Tax=Deinococcus hopiensis TaxID=309885 RepID=UPI001BAF2E7A
MAVADEKTLLLPERRGNNCADSLRNIFSDPHAALLFLIPGIGETLRVNGRARITPPELLKRSAVKGIPPRCAVTIEVDTVFFRCARAIHRCGLWQPPRTEHLEKVPSVQEQCLQRFRAALWTARPTIWPCWSDNAQPCTDRCVSFTHKAIRDERGLLSIYPPVKIFMSNGWEHILMERVRVDELSKRYVPLSGQMDANSGVHLLNSWLHFEQGEGEQHAVPPVRLEQVTSAAVVYPQC